VIQRVFKAFQYRDFRLMWIGACTSSIGTWMQVLAQGWLVLTISGSAFMLGLDAFLANIPIFLFSLIGGVISDRIDRRHVLLSSQYVQMGSAFLLTALIWLKWVKIWHILCLSFVSGFAQAFGGPAYFALIPMLVEKEDMPNAIALNSIQFNLARVIGPVIGGITLTKLGAVWCFGLNGLSFLAPVISLLTIAVRFQPEKSGESILNSIKQGIAFIRSKAAMETLIVLSFCMTALAIPMLTFLPVFAKDVFHKGPGVFTLFLSFSGGGSVVGALGVAGMGNMRRKGRAMLVMLLLTGAGMAGFALSKYVVVSCILLFLSGAALMGVFSTLLSLVQLITSNEMRGRVMSVYNVAFRGGMPMGNLASGWLVPIFSAPAVLSVNGALLLILALYFLLSESSVAAL
jgi:predicted MFS family arabinose efflux permease